jgi:glycerol-3-phosphate acyltransferase PlsY
MIETIFFGIIAYLLGSIPTAVWLGRLKYNTDIREHGSKNAGATNTFRVLGKKPGIFVLTFDVLKGVLAVLLPYFVLDLPWGTEELIHIQLICAILAVIGHVLPVFASFKGGKGVATSLGVIIGVHPPAAGICVLIFLIVFIASQYVSLGAIIASISFPMLLFFAFKVSSFWLLVFSCVLSTAVIFAHRKNIGRLIRLEENKMNLFKK